MLVEIDRDREAVAVLMQALRIAPDDDRILCQLSLAFYHLDDFIESLRYANLAIESDPHSEWAFRLRSLALQKLGRTAEALAPAREAVALSPEQYMTWMVLTQAEMANKDLKAADRTAVKLKQLAPGHEDAFITLSLLTLRQRKWALAEQYCRSALQVCPTSYAAMNNLALALAARGKRRKAVECMYNAAKLAPAQEKPRTNLVNQLDSFLLFGERTSVGRNLLALVLVLLTVTFWLALRALGLNAIEATLFTLPPYLGTLLLLNRSPGSLFPWLIRRRLTSLSPNLQQFASQRKLTFPSQSYGHFVIVNCLFGYWLGRLFFDGKDFSTLLPLNAPPGVRLLSGIFVLLIVIGGLVIAYQNRDEIVAPLRKSSKT